MPSCLSLAGRTLTTAQELYEVVNELISPHALKVSVEDEGSCDAALATLTSRFSQQEKAQRKLALDQSRGAAEDLIGAIDKTVNPEEAFYAAYERTLESKEKIRKLTIEELLQKGKSVVDSHLCEPGKCPSMRHAIRLNRTLTATRAPNRRIRCCSQRVRGG